MQWIRIETESRGWHFLYEPHSATGGDTRHVQLPGCRVMEAVEGAVKAGPQVCYPPSSAPEDSSDLWREDGDGQGGGSTQTQD